MCEWWELSFIIHGNTKWHSNFGTLWKFPAKLKHGFQCHPVVTPIGLCSSHLKSYVYTKSACKYYGSFFPNHQELEAVRHLSVGEWINNLWCMHTTEQYSVTKSSELSSLSKIRMVFTVHCHWGRSLWVNATNCKIPFLW